MKRDYQYFKNTELFLPNQMSYLELAFEDIVSNKENALQKDLEKYTDIPTKHREICDRLAKGLDTVIEKSDECESYYRHYGHLLVDLGLMDDRRKAPIEPLSSSRLRSVYVNDIGYEFMHANYEEQQWFINLVEGDGVKLDPEWLLEAYEDIVRTDQLGRFFGIQYVGQKRFSIEGCESLIPSVERVIKSHVTMGYNDVVIGMPHRGRVATIVNIMGVSVSSIMETFEGKNVIEQSGDVKYHLGHSVDRVYQNNSYHIALAYNPSHLEAINSVVCGNVRARIDRKETTPFGILIHGDAAISGQGVVMEILAMSQVPAYHTGGTVHIVVNNQIGFTTNPQDSRSSTYCTDIAKMIQAPVLHVSADSVESVLRASVIASMYRHKFKKDVFIDLIGHRQYGHNEADEPSATQPLMYAKIRSHPGVYKLYKDYLLNQGVALEKLQSIENGIQALIKQKVSLIKCNTEAESSRHKDWVALDQIAWDAKYKSPVSQTMVKEAAKQLVEIPKDFQLQRQVAKVMEQRIEMSREEKPLNWGMAELIAYQVLLNMGCSVRLVGQDAIRGTFSHRMASVYDQNSGDRFELLKYKDRAKFYNYNSILSEYAALGFEYGYAETRPNDLVIFEAQFGDFINGAQIIIDQFISSGYQKWQRYCHLVMLLPHGYEGQGPEHSSARLERFLQLCAQDNIQICIPSTPAQMYSLLLRQMVRNYRRPLVVFTPKSLLRHPSAVSKMEELSTEFTACIPDTEISDGEKVVLCSGKIYYDLLQGRQKAKIALIRLEQLHPFPTRSLAKLLKSYTQLKEVVWVQEEPLNQGAWLYIRDWLHISLPTSVILSVVSREPSAAPAVGYSKKHQMQQEVLVKQVFEG